MKVRKYQSTQETDRKKYNSLKDSKGWKKVQISVKYNIIDKWRKQQKEEKKTLAFIGS
jgi:hypothetical protein